jgi:hypothetical protein
VTGVGHPVCGRRTLEKDERSCTVPLRQRLLIDVVFFPELEDRFFLYRELDVGLYSAKHRSLIIGEFNGRCVAIHIINIFCVRVAFEHPVIRRFDLVFIFEFFLEVIIEINDALPLRLLINRAQIIKLR